MAALGLSYLNTIVILGVLYRKRAVFGITPASLASLAFAGLICLPLSINLVRKALLAVELQIRPMDCLHLLNADGRVSATQQLLGHIGEALLDVVEHTSEEVRLKALQSKLLAEPL